VGKYRKKKNAYLAGTKLKQDWKGILFGVLTTLTLHICFKAT
jgi:hypothetical protein